MAWSFPLNVYFAKAQNITANNPAVKRNPPMPKTMDMIVMRNNATNPSINLMKTFIRVLTAPQRTHKTHSRPTSSAFWNYSSIF